MEPSRAYTIASTGIFVGLHVLFFLNFLDLDLPPSITMVAQGLGELMEANRDSVLVWIPLLATFGLVRLLTRSR